MPEPTAAAKRAAEAISDARQWDNYGPLKEQIAAIIDAEVRALVDTAARLQVELGKLKTDFEATLLDRNELLAHYQRVTAENLALVEALDCIPAQLMLTVGPPYTLHLSEGAVKQIAAALARAKGSDGQ